MLTTWVLSCEVNVELTCEISNFGISGVLFSWLDCCSYTISINIHNYNDHDILIFL